MKSARSLIAINALLAAVLACSVGQAAPSDLAATITSQAQTLQAPTSTPPPADTPADTPTITPTGTPTTPQVTVSSSTNCRTGPSTEYDLLYTMNPGQAADVIGKNTSTNYWIINFPGGTCWLWGQYATVSGNIAVLPEYPIPPLPTPAEPAAPKNFKGTASCSPGGGLLQVNVHISLTWTDVASNEEGYRVFRDDKLIVTLAPNSTGYQEDTSHLLLVIIGSTPPPPWSVTYGVEAFNNAGKSDRKEVTLNCS
jgi:hypothetical protein